MRQLSCFDGSCLGKTRVGKEIAPKPFVNKHFDGFPPNSSKKGEYPLKALYPLPTCDSHLLGLAYAEQLGSL